MNVSGRNHLIEENKALRSRLAIAEDWMRREVQGSLKNIKHSQIKKTTRGYFDNVFEEEAHDIIHEKMHGYFAEYMNLIPEHAKKRIFDSEVQWYVLQKYPHMDAIGMVILYQKILDNWIEDTIISQFRKSMKNHTFENITLRNILKKKYTLSFGRFYEWIQDPDAEEFQPLTTWLHSEFAYIADRIFSQDFVTLIASIMERDIFSLKRHQGKMSFSDAKFMRKVCLGDFQERTSIFFLLFSLRP